MSQSTIFQSYQAVASKFFGLLPNQFQTVRTTDLNPALTHCSLETPKG